MEVITIDETTLDEFISLNHEITEKTKRLNEIKELLKEIGSFSTTTHVCAVFDQSRTIMASVPEAILVFGKQMLVENDLIKTSCFKVVKVSRKAV